MSSGTPQTIAALPAFLAERFGDRAALIFEERQTSFQKLEEYSARVANALIAAGVKPGDRVGMLAKDSDHAFEALFGIARAGAVVMGINWRLAPPEIRFIVEDSGAEVLLVGPDQIATLEEIRGELPALKTIVVLGPPHGEWPDYVSWRDAASPADPGVTVEAEDPAAQMYTSGTTGLPKGVRLAHRSFFAIVRSLKEHDDPWIGWSQKDVSLHAIPLFHIGGLWWAMTAFGHGATTVVLDAFAGWKALELLEKHQVTKVCFVPAMLQVMLSEPDCKTTDFTSLDTIVYGGSPIPKPNLDKSIETFGCGFAQIYGLTETGNTAVCLRPEDHLGDPGLLRAAGKPYPGVQLKILSESGDELGPGEIGEVCIHSPANMLGYWNRPEATEETLIDGWVHTGDAGYLDENGYLFVCDRVKDMIIYAGENIYPAEIESVLCGHPAVAEAAVIGVPDDKWGELVKAIVVLKPGAEATSPQIIAHVRRHIADFKVPRSVDFVDSLPRTPSGKIQKAKLRAPYWEGRERKVN